MKQVLALNIANCSSRLGTALTFKTVNTGFDDSSLGKKSDSMLPTTETFERVNMGFKATFGRAYQGF